MKKFSYLLLLLLLHTQHTQARYDCKIFLTARDCSSCLHMAAAMEQLPYFIRPDVYVDGHLDSTEFNYFIDTLLNLDRKRYNFFQTKKEFATHNINVIFFLNDSGKTVFKCRLADIPVYIDSIKQHYTDFYEINTIPLDIRTPILSRAKLSKQGDMIFIANSKVHELMVVTDALQYTIRTKDLPFDSVLTALKGDTTGIAGIKKTYQDPNVYFPPFELQDYWYDANHVYVLYQFNNPTIENDNNRGVLNIRFIPMYFVAQYYVGQLKKIYSIKQKAFAAIDSEKNYPSTFGRNSFMVKGDKLYVIVENPLPQKQEYYVCELKLNKTKNQFEFSKKIQTGLSPLISNMKKNMDTINFIQNWAFIGDNKLWMMTQNVYYDFEQCQWKQYTFHLPELTADTATIFKHFIVFNYSGAIKNKYKVMVIYPSGPGERSSNAYTTIFDEHMRQVHYYNTYNFMICNKSSAWVESDRVYVIEPDKKLHVYGIKHTLE